MHNINTRILHKITKVRKIEPVNGLKPGPRMNHQSVLIGTEENQKPYLVTYSGLDENKVPISSLTLFDI